MQADRSDDYLSDDASQASAGQVLEESERQARQRSGGPLQHDPAAVRSAPRAHAVLRSPRTDDRNMQSSPTHMQKQQQQAAAAAAYSRSSATQPQMPLPSRIGGAFAGDNRHSSSSRPRSRLSDRGGSGGGGGAHGSDDPDASVAPSGDPDADESDLTEGELLHPVTAGSYIRDLDLSLDGTLMSSGEEHAERQLLRQMHQAGLSVHAQSARGAPPAAQSRASFLPASLTGTPRHHRSASPPSAHFSAAELEILSRMDALRSGLESYKSHTASSLRTLARAHASSKSQMLAQVTRQVSELEGRLARVYAEHADTAGREGLAGQLEMLRAEIAQFKRRESARSEALEARLRSTESALEGLRDAATMHADGSHAKLAQLKSELQTQFAQRLQTLQVEFTSQLSSVRPLAASAPGATLIDPMSPAFAAAASSLQAPLISEVAALKEANASLLQRLSDVDAAATQRTRDLERKLAAAALEAERAQKQDQAAALEAVESSFAARLTALEARLTKESATRERAAREAAEEARRRESALQASFDAALAAARLDADEKVRDAATRFAASLARAENNASQALAKLAAQVSKEANEREQDLMQIVVEQVTSSSAGGGGGSSMHTPRKTAPSVHASSSLPSLGFDGAFFKDQLSALESRLADSEGAWRSALETEARKRRELSKVKLARYEDIQKQIMDDVVALHAALGRIKVAQAKVATRVAKEANNGLVLRELQTAVEQVQKDLGTQHTNLTNTHTGLKTLMEQMDALCTTVAASTSGGTTNPSSVGGGPKKKLLVSVTDEKQSTGQSAGVPPGEFESPTSGSRRVSPTRGESTDDALSGSAPVALSSLSQTQSQLIRSQKKLIARYRTLAADFAALKSAYDASAGSAGQSAREMKQEMAALRDRVVETQANLASQSQAQANLQQQQRLMQAQQSQAMAAAAVSASDAPLAPHRPAASSASTVSSQPTVLLSDFQLLSSDHAALESRFQDAQSKASSERQQLLRSLDALTESSSLVDAKLREQNLAWTSRLVEAESKSREAMAQVVSKVTESDARLTLEVAKATHDLSTLSASITALQKQRIDPADLAAVQDLVASLTAASKSQATQLADVKSALGTAESKLSALALDGSNQESFNYDLSGQIVKIGSMVKALEARLGFADGKITSADKRTAEEKKHVDESLGVLAASLQNNALALQKTQDRLVGILDSLHEVEHALALHTAAAKKIEKRVNAVEQNGGGGGGAMQLSEVATSNKPSTTPSSSSDTSSGVSASIVNALLARVQTLEGESELPRSHTLRLDSLELSLASLSKATATLGSQTSGLDGKVVALAAELVYVVNQKLPESASTINHLQARIEELHRRAMEHAESGLEEVTRKVRAMDKAVEAAQRDANAASLAASSEAKQQLQFRSELRAEIEAVQAQVDKLSKQAASEQTRRLTEQADADSRKAASTGAPPSSSSGSDVTVTASASPALSISPASEALLHSKVDALTARVGQVEQIGDQRASATQETQRQQRSQIDATLAALNEQRAQLSALQSQLKGATDAAREAASRKEIAALTDTLQLLSERADRVADEMRVHNTEIAALKTASDEVNTRLAELVVAAPASASASSAAVTSPVATSASSLVSPTATARSQQLVQAELHQINTSIEHLKRRMDHVTDESSAAVVAQNKRIAALGERLDEAGKGSFVAAMAVPVYQASEEAVAKIKEQVASNSAAILSTQAEVKGIAAEQKGLQQQVQTMEQTVTEGQKRADQSGAAVAALSSDLAATKTDLSALTQQVASGAASSKVVEALASRVQTVETKVASLEKGGVVVAPAAAAPSSSSAASSAAPAPAAVVSPPAVAAVAPAAAAAVAAPKSAGPDAATLEARRLAAERVAEADRLEAERQDAAEAQRAAAAAQEKKRLKAEQDAQALVKAREQQMEAQRLVQEQRDAEARVAAIEAENKRVAQAEAAAAAAAAAALAAKKKADEDAAAASAASAATAAAAPSNDNAERAAPSPARPAPLITSTEGRSSAAPAVGSLAMAPVPSPASAVPAAGGAGASASSSGAATASPTEVFSPINKQHHGSDAASASTQVRSQVGGTPAGASALAAIPAASPSSSSASAGEGGLVPNGLYAVSISLSCKGLPRSFARKPNPLVVLYERRVGGPANAGSAASTKLSFVCKTEWAEADTEPTFYKQFEGKYRNAPVSEVGERMMLFRVYDVSAGATSSGTSSVAAGSVEAMTASAAAMARAGHDAQVQESDRLGDVSVSLGDIVRLAASSNGQSKQLSFGLKHSTGGQTLRAGVTPAQVAKLNERVASSLLLLDVTVWLIPDSNAAANGSHKMTVRTDPESDDAAWASVMSPRAGLSPSSVVATPSRLESVSTGSSFGASFTSRLVPHIAGLDESAVTSLLQGQEFLKYPSGFASGLLSNPADSTVFLDLTPQPGGAWNRSASGGAAGRNGIYWCRAGSRTLDPGRFIPFSELQSVAAGNTHKIFAKFLGKPRVSPSGATYRASPDTCFTITARSRSLGLEAKTPKQRDAWVKALHIILTNPTAVTFRSKDNGPLAPAGSPKSAASKQATSASSAPGGPMMATPQQQSAAESRAKEHSLHVNFEQLLEESNPLDQANEPGESAPASSAGAVATSSSSPTAAVAASASGPIATMFPPLSAPSARRLIVRSSCRGLPAGSTPWRLLALEEANADFEFLISGVTELVPSGFGAAAGADTAAGSAPSFQTALGFELQPGTGQLVQFSVYEFPSKASLPPALNVRDPRALVRFLSNLSPADRANARLGTVLAESDDLAAGSVDMTSASASKQLPPLVYEIQEHDEDDDDEDSSDPEAAAAARAAKAARPRKLLKPAHLILSCSLLAPSVSGDMPRSTASAGSGGASPRTPDPAGLSDSISPSHAALNAPPPAGFEVRDFYSPRGGAGAAGSAAASSASGRPGVVSQNVEMRVACSNLPKLAASASSAKNPATCVVLYEQAVGASSSRAAEPTWTEVTRTEWQTGSASPAFAQSLQFAAVPPFNALYKLLVFEVDASQAGSQALPPQQALAQFVFPLSTVLAPSSPTAAAASAVATHSVTVDLTSPDSASQARLNQSKSKITLQTRLNRAAAAGSNAAAPSAAAAGMTTPAKKAATAPTDSAHRSPVTGRAVVQADGSMLTPQQRSRHDVFAVSASKSEKARTPAQLAPAAATARQRGISSVRHFLLYIRCRNLPPRSSPGGAPFSPHSPKSHAPIAALFVQHRNGAFNYSSQTEWSTSADPDFQNPLELTLDPDTSGELLKLNVYDTRREAVTDADRLGSVLVRFSDVIHSTNELAFALAHENQEQNAMLQKHNVLLIMKCEEVQSLGAALAAAAPGPGNSSPTAAAPAHSSKARSPAAAAGTSGAAAALLSESMSVEDFDADEQVDRAKPAAGAGQHQQQATDHSFSLGGTEGSLDLDSPVAAKKTPTATAAKTAAAANNKQAAAAAASAASAAASRPPAAAAVLPSGIIAAPGFPVGSGREVSISISCRDLPRTKGGGLLAVDPIAAAFVQDPRTSHFVMAAQTEWLHNQPNPDFDSLVSLDYHDNGGQIIKFSVYDVSSAAVRDHECIGSVLVRLDDIIHSGRELRYELLHEDASKAARIKGAIIILTYENEAEEEEGEEAIAPTPAKAAAASSATPKQPLQTPARGTVAGRLSMSPDSSSDEEPTPRRGVPSSRNR